MCKQNNLNLDRLKEFSILLRICEPFEEKSYNNYKLDLYLENMESGEEKKILTDIYDSLKNKSTLNFKKAYDYYTEDFRFGHYKKLSFQEKCFLDSLIRMKRENERLKNELEEKTKYTSKQSNTDMIEIMSNDEGLTSVVLDKERYVDLLSKEDELLELRIKIKELDEDKNV